MGAGGHLAKWRATESFNLYMPGNKWPQCFEWGEIWFQALKNGGISRPVCQRTTSTPLNLYSVTILNLRLHIPDQWRYLALYCNQRACPGNQRVNNIPLVSWRESGDDDKKTASWQILYTFSLPIERFRPSQQPHQRNLLTTDMRLWCTTLRYIYLHGKLCLKYKKWYTADLVPKRIARIHRVKTHELKRMQQDHVWWS